jgi:hypothetical protein
MARAAATARHSCAARAAKAKKLAAVRHTRGDYEARADATQTPDACWTARGCLELYRMTKRFIDVSLVQLFVRASWLLVSARAGAQSTKLRMHDR